MQLCYFLPPCTMALGNIDNNGSSQCKTTKNHLDVMDSLSLEDISRQENVGHSVTVSIEASPRPNLLPTGSLYASNKQNGGALDPLPLGPNNR